MIVSGILCNICKMCSMKTPKLIASSIQNLWFYSRNFVYKNLRGTKYKITVQVQILCSYRSYPAVVALDAS